MKFYADVNRYYYEIDNIIFKNLYILYYENYLRVGW